MRLLKVEHSVAAPGALIGASNFFELAVATAIALSAGSGAALDSCRENSLPLFLFEFRIIL
jgi:ACR3 family arsenite efflux pump ArsB